VAGATNWDLAVAKRQATANGYYVGADRDNGGGAGKTGYRFMLGDTAATRTDTAYVPVPLGEWVFVAAVLDRAAKAQKISVDGGATWASTTPPPGAIAPARDLGLGWDIGENNYWFRGEIDDVALFNRALSASQIKRIMQKGMTPELADGPQPKNSIVDLPRDLTLSWTAGLYAGMHDLYVGTSPADVSAASRANPLGVLVAQGQTATTYDLRGLAFGQTYYWRVDEVNAPPASTIFKGEVWHFTVEPSGYVLAGGQITATASSSSTPEEGPANTINGSGLDANDLHAVDTTKMWLSGAGDSAWIRYEFDKVYSLYQMLVWNHNAMTEPLIGFGIQEATIEYSVDGTAWTRLGESHTFGRASGKANYTFNTTVDFGGAAAKFVRITAVSNWGGILKQYGLSEVRFLYIPVSARQPEPLSGAKGVAPQQTLSWRPGRQAAKHEVYLSTDKQAVVDGTAPVMTVSEPRFEPAALDLAQTYYWKVNEVNDAAPVKVWQGDVWSFSTPDSLVVDDFESYTAEEGNRIYEIWIDGWENKTGSQVGYLDAPFVEQTIVHGGRQSMPLTYNNGADPFYSETERTFDEPQDWTANGVVTLTLYFRGALGNDGKLYVKINNTKVAYDGDPGDIARLIWQPWNIDLKSVGGNLTSVKKLTVGVEGNNAKGVLYIDDIVLSPKAAQSVKVVEPDSTKLVAHYAFEGNTNDSSKNGRNGVIAGAPTYVAGVRGQAMKFDGVDDYVRVAHHDNLNPGADSMTFTFWANVDPVTGGSGSTNWDLAVAKRDVGARGYYVGADRNQGGAKQTGFKLMLGNTAGTRVDTPFALAPMGEWVFVAAVLDRAQNVHKISVDGGQTWASAKPPTGQIAPTQDLGIGYDIGVKDFWFNGTLDEVRIYSYALSNEELAWLAGGR
ncbi:MAG: discoidin domain-containing protein, partial [Planctomycetes bacterium]|nr:discoidin domain-containing protein [Planctomycetota bacterium]